MAGINVSALGAMPEIAEEHDSATSLIAAIEAGRGIALVASVLSSLAGSRLMLREIQPAQCRSLWESLIIDTISVPPCAGLSRPRVC